MPTCSAYPEGIYPFKLSEMEEIKAYGKKSYEIKTAKNA